MDRHLSTARRNKLALIWVGENTDEVRTFSYFALNREVEQMANVLKAMGVRKGDVVTIYLPRIPEIFFAMLACAKIGAVHSVVLQAIRRRLLTRVLMARSRRSLSPSTVRGLTARSFP
ncbi:AMP-binding protein [Cutibacterium acnes]|uniref:AMP-binding protein n=1 Tax=Cutibacterium acnes TaxID=1747 RepID=UPI0007FBFAB6|nr:AMP-binding protein [Cutibacterium acnes]OAY01028.1 hypothetical protein A9Y79_07965 [Cutibacterium acnes]